MDILLFLNGAIYLKVQQRQYQEEKLDLNNYSFWALCAHLSGIIVLKIKNGIWINTISSFLFKLFFQTSRQANFLNFLSRIGEHSNFWIKTCKLLNNYQLTFRNVFLRTKIINIWQYYYTRKMYTLIINFNILESFESI